MRTGIYPGTFDPVTMGHLDIITRGLSLVDQLIVAVVRTPPKETLFSLKERVEMIEGSLPKDLPIAVESMDGLLVDFAHKKRASVVIRGLRALSDFEYEFQMALMNRRLEPELEVIFMVPDITYIYLSGSLIREVAELGGDIDTLVPEIVKQKLKQKFGSRKRRS
ncbi:MAG: pantetheine-phosphate adenylyltransferase [Candidatus Glassbacteria bacterium]